MAIFKLKFNKNKKIKKSKQKSNKLIDIKEKKGSKQGHDGNIR